jgi:predicted Zn-ribbon and HTH transcriptional regulator
MSLLGIASSLMFPTVRDIAITQLAQYTLQDPILKLIAAKKYGLDDWLVSAFNALAQRDEPLNPADVQRLYALGKAEDVMDLILKIAAIRERFSTSTTAAGCASCRPCASHSVLKCVADCTLSVSRATYDFTPHIHELLGYRDGTAPSPVNAPSDLEFTRLEALRSNHAADKRRRQKEEEVEVDKEKLQQADAIQQRQA